jgi:hypothetical protein
MAFCGKEFVRGETVTNNKIIQANTFNYSGCSKLHEGDKGQAYVSPSFSSFLKVTDLTNTIFKQSKVQKHTRINNYNELALPTLIYGSKNWLMKANDKTRITTAEMKFVRTTSK